MMLHTKKPNLFLAGTAVFLLWLSWGGMSKIVSIYWKNWESREFIDFTEGKPKGENQGLLVNISCDADKFTMLMKKQKTDMFQIFLNGEYVEKIKYNGGCKVGELAITYNFALLDKTEQICQMGRRVSECVYESTSYVTVKKNGTQLAKFHLYPYERMYLPLKIKQIEVNNKKITFCTNATIDNFYCESFTPKQLLAKPIITQYGSGTILD